MLETVKYLIGTVGESGYGSKSTADQVTESCPDLRSITAIITGKACTPACHNHERRIFTTSTGHIYTYHVCVGARVWRGVFLICMGFNFHQALRLGSEPRRLVFWPSEGRGWSSRRETSRLPRTSRPVSCRNVPSPRSLSCLSILALLVLSETLSRSLSPSICLSISSCKTPETFFFPFLILCCLLAEETEGAEATLSLYFSFRASSHFFFKVSQPNIPVN